MNIDWTQVDFAMKFVTPIIALAALCLGIFNYRIASKPHRLDVRATASTIRHLREDDPHAEKLEIRVDVTNNSYFAINVREIGFRTQNKKRNRTEFCALALDAHKKIESRDHHVFGHDLTAEKIRYSRGFFYLANHPTAEGIQNSDDVYVTLSNGVRIFCNIEKDFLKQLCEYCDMILWGGNPPLET